MRRGSQRPYRSCQRLQGAPVLRSQPAAVYAGVEWRFFEEVLLGAGTQASPLQGWRERTAVRKLSGTAQLHSLVRYTDYMVALCWIWTLGGKQRVVESCYHRTVLGVWRHHLDPVGVYLAQVSVSR